MMTLLGELRDDLHYQVGDAETQVSDERFLYPNESFLQSSYFRELCLFRGRFGTPTNPNEVRKKVSEDILNILSSLGNRQEILTLVGVSKRI